MKNLQRLNKFIAILVLIAFTSETLFAEGPKASTQPTVEASEKTEVNYLSADALKALLLRPIPEYKGVNAFFNEIQKDPKAQAYYSKLVAEDDDLRAFAQDGGAFRNAYFGLLQTDFGEDQGFMVTPEKKIIEYARTLPRNDTQKTLIPINQRRATFLAWDDTVLEFNLPDDMSLDQLEQNLHIKKYSTAVDFYYKRQNFYLEQEEKKDALELPPIVNLKSRLSEKFTDLRIKNFHQALVHAQELGRKELSATFKIKDQPLKLSLKDLELAKLTISPPSLGEVTAKFHSINNDNILIQHAKAYTANRIKKFDVAGAQSFYFTQEHGPLIPINVMTLTFESRKSISISERDFNRLIHELHPNVDHFTTKDLFTRRYLLEASKRDTILADAINLINEKTDSDFSGLEKRLYSQLKKFDITEVTESSLTEEVRVNMASSKADEGLDQIKWAGYAIHPDYWRVRDEVAAEKKRADVNTMKDSQVKARPADHLSKFQYLHKARKSSATKGAVLMWIYRTAVWAAIALATSALHSGAKAAKAAYQGAQQEQQQKHGDAENPKKVEHNGRGAIEKFLSKMVGKVTGTGSGSGSEGRDADDSMEEVQGTEYYPTIYIKNSPLYKIENAQAETAFRIVDSKIPEKDLPVLFGITKIIDSYYGMQKPVILRSEPGDFSVEAYVPHHNSGGIIPIIIPVGYHLVGLKLYGDGKSISLDNVSIEEVPSSGSTFVRTGLDNNIAYTYKANYAAVMDYNSKDRKFEHLQAPILKQLNSLIAHSGETELSLKLNDVLNKDNITVGDIEQAFYSTGYFTFDAYIMGLSYNQYHDGLVNLDLSVLLGTNNDHALHYQSRMANALLAEYLQKYYNLAQEKISVQNVTGFFRAPGHLSVSRATYNFTEVSRLDANHVYRELDATPYRMDPSTYKPPTVWTRMPFDPDREGKQIEAQAREQKRLDEAAAKEAAKLAKENAEQKAREEQYEKDKRDHKYDVHAQPFFYTKKTELDIPEELLLHPEEKIVPDPLEVLRQKKLARLIAIRDQVHKAIVGDPNPQLKEAATPQMPGIRLLGLSRILVEHYSGKIDENNTVIQLEAWQSNMGPLDKLSGEEIGLLNKDVQEKIAKAGSAQKAIEEIFQDNANSYQAKLNRELKLVKDSRPPLYSYLLNPEIQNSLSQLSTFMTKYLEDDHVTTNCDSDLSSLGPKAK